jgi:hypothetical protein
MDVRQGLLFRAKGIIFRELANGSRHSKRHLRLGASGFAALFKTTSNLYLACGLIFKGLIGYLSMIIHIQSLGVNP